MRTGEILDSDGANELELELQISVTTTVTTATATGIIRYWWFCCYAWAIQRNDNEDYYSTSC
jgi:hypothetical protein